MKPFLTQTHFIGYPLPKDLEDTITVLRQYTASRYNCHSGHSTLPHITIIPPFTLSDEFTTDDILKRLEDIKFKPFTSFVEGFGSFSDRTVFANVKASKDWDNLRNTVFKAISDMGDIKKDKRPMKPHITIANRDIPPNKAPEILERLQTYNIDKEIKVDRIALFTRVGYKWVLQSENIIFL
ncbi:MAG: 2'-5' RNA ligase family protein [Spirochaetales bacterium]|nr:2'-5' RNA ligase family protein [Spirochaetales bacterium]